MYMRVGYIQWSYEYHTRLNCISEQTVLVNNRLILTCDQLNEIYCTDKCLNLHTGRFRKLVFINFKTTCFIQ